MNKTNELSTLFMGLYDRGKLDGLIAAKETIEETVNQEEAVLQIEEKIKQERNRWK